MGIFKSIGKGMYGVAKGTAIGTARTSASIAEGIGKATGAYGKRVVSQAMKNPLMTSVAIGGIAAASYGLADADGMNNSGEIAGKMAIGTAALTAIPGATTAMAGVAMGAAGYATSVGGLALGLGQRMVKMPDAPVRLSNLGDIKLSGIGYTAMFGSAFYEGASRALGKWEGIRMGTNDNLMRTQTPTIPTRNSQPSYANNGGATGDLVFSMYNNR